MTELTDFQRKLSAFLPNLDLRFQEPMAKHTSFRIGGPVEVMAFPRNREELAELLKTSALLDCKTAILGAGTNVLAPDEGIDGLVICLKDCLDGMERLDDTRIRVMAGVTMTRAAVFASNLGLGGMEFAHGIPGSVGGGVYMNAGAYGGELCQIVESVEVMDLAGNIRRLSNEQMQFSYRHSVLDQGPDEGTRGKTFRIPASGPALCRFGLQAACGRLCRCPHRSGRAEGLSGRRCGNFRQTRRLCRKSWQCNSGRCEKSAAAGFG